MRKTITLIFNKSCDESIAEILDKTNGLFTKEEVQSRIQPIQDYGQTFGFTFTYEEPKYQIIESKTKVVLFQSNSLLATIKEFFTARKIVLNPSIKFCDDEDDDNDMASGHQTFQD